MFNGLIDEMISSGCTASDAGKFPRPPSDLPKDPRHCFLHAYSVPLLPADQIIGTLGYSIT